MNCDTCDNEIVECCERFTRRENHIANNKCYRCEHNVCLWLNNTTIKRCWYCYLMIENDEYGSIIDNVLRIVKKYIELGKSDAENNKNLFDCDKKSVFLEVYQNSYKLHYKQMPKNAIDI